MFRTANILNFSRSAKFEHYFFSYTPIFCAYALRHVAFSVP